MHGDDLRTINNENFINLNKKVLEYLEQNLAGIADSITIKKLAKEIDSLATEKEKVNALLSVGVLSATHNIQMVKYALQFTSDNAAKLLMNLGLGSALPKNEESMLSLLNFAKRLDNERFMHGNRAVGNTGSVNDVLEAVYILAKTGDLEKVLNFSFKYSRPENLSAIKYCAAPGWFGRKPSDADVAKCVDALLKSRDL